MLMKTMILLKESDGFANRDRGKTVPTRAHRRRRWVPGKHCIVCLKDLYIFSRYLFLALRTFLELWRPWIWILAICKYRATRSRKLTRTLGGSSTFKQIGQDWAGISKLPELPPPFLQDRRSKGPSELLTVARDLPGPEHTLASFMIFKELREKMRKRNWRWPAWVSLVTV